MSELVELRFFIPTLVIDLRYATKHNFTGQVLYVSTDCSLIQPTARKLLSAQNEFRSLALGLKVFDAFRPLSVQRRLWEIFPDDRYVANPAIGSRHSRGTAVDVTLIDLAGNELEMPTSFDEFTVQAHRSYQNLPKRVVENRKLLEDVMTRNGFVGLTTEWWHFDDSAWEHYPIIDS
jgi:D-alanyl-D-alanine dipeptidase